jgi:hypothetical protein
MAPGQPVAATGRSERSSARALFGACLRAVSLVTAVVMTASACSGTTAGTAQRANDTTTAATTSTTPTVVPTVGIKGKLLSLAQLGAIVGDTDMKQLRSWAEPNIDTAGVDPFDCTAAVLVATNGGYYQKTRQAMIGDTDRGAGGWVAAQVISVFASRADTAPFLSAMASDWSSCIRKGAITMTGPPSQHWTPGQIEQGDARIAITVTRNDPPPPRTCHHVLAAQANIVVDALVCGDGDTVAPTNQIADKLLAKFPK